MGTEHFMILLVGKRKRKVSSGESEYQEQMQWKPNNSFWEGSAIPQEKKTVVLSVVFLVH